ncbi:MAG: response regulator [Vicinamibacterales bacterium]
MAPENLPEGASPNAAEVRDVPMTSAGPEAVLREGRQRFVAGFPKRCESLEMLVNAISTRGPRGLTAPLREIAHQIAGMAGTVGFPMVSNRATELEELATRTEYGFDLPAARVLIEAIREAFAADLANPPAWALAPGAARSTGARILVVDDEPDQRELLGGFLRTAGYETILVETGDAVMAAARSQRPALILLDANLPGMDGYAVCRLLKSDPELSAIPVVFTTVRSSLDDRLAGLTLGADDYLLKPIQTTELLLRLDLLLRRRGGRTPDTERVEGRQGQLLSYELFVRVAREQLRLSAASFALVRVPENEAATVITVLRNSVRARDIVSRYDQNHVVMLLAGAPPALLRHRLTDQVEALKARGIRGVWAGIASTSQGGEKPLEALLAEADDALAEARYLGEPAALKTDNPRTCQPAGLASVLLAEDDPEVVKIVETQFLAAGYCIESVSDGIQALEALAARPPDVLVLDLVLPGASGFEVLERIAGAERRPRVVILSAHGREDEVTKAFEMGADDYVTKPFSPRELLARVVRLLR